MLSEFRACRGDKREATVSLAVGGGLASEHRLCPPPSVSQPARGATTTAHRAPHSAAGQRTSPRAIIRERRPRGNPMRTWGHWRGGGAVVRVVAGRTPRARTRACSCTLSCPPAPSRRFLHVVPATQPAGPVVPRLWAALPLPMHA